MSADSEDKVNTKTPHQNQTRGIQNDQFAHLDTARTLKKCTLRHFKWRRRQGTYMLGIFGQVEGFLAGCVAAAYHS